jgi:hypothetical protein
MAIQSVKRLQTSPRINTDKRGSEKIARKSFSPLPRSSVFQKVFSAQNLSSSLCLRASVVGFAFFLISVHPRKSAAKSFLLLRVSAPPC